MDVDAEMLKWSQTVYGIAHSLQIAKSIHLGNLESIVESLRAVESWNISNVGFSSCVPRRDFYEGAIKLDGHTHDEIFQRVSENVVQVLFVSLNVFADEVLGYLINKTGAAPGNFLINKLEWAKPRIDSKFHWAINGLFEMVAIRNAIVHNNAKWNAATVAQLRLAGVGTVDEKVQISLSFGDLFRYKRALRTISGEIRKIGT
jgi:hypothetical protein